MSLFECKRYGLVDVLDVVLLVLDVDVLEAEFKQIVYL